MNKRWEIGEKNVYGNECYILYFTQFYDEEFVIGFVKDNKDDDTYFITSPLLKIEQDCVFATDIEDAKEQCEEMVRDYILDQVNYYEDMLEKFIEK